MRTTFTSSLALLLVFLATSGRAVAQTSSPEARPASAPLPPPRTLRVNAEGSATVRPDLAVVLAGVQVTAKDPQKASDDASARMKALLAELRRLGLAERDVQTSELSLRPERPWENGRQLPVQGYTATMSVRVKVRKLEQLPGLLGRLTAVGVNEIDSVQLGKEELGPVRDQALALAVSAARARAQAVASAAGVTLGDVISIEIDPSRGPSPVTANVALRAAAVPASDVPVAEGELEVTARVEMVYAIR
ncbi:MAG TPA: SIMPL domain-containing protein [Anaeromyxobacteraceae bacterium]|nr:SIMPL domain-containing protein [Anaeromyxobacteraceae bacterium]